MKWRPPTAEEKWREAMESWPPESRPKLTLSTEPAKKELPNLWAGSPPVVVGTAYTSGSRAMPQLPHKKGVHVFMDPTYLCPDVLDIHLIGPADYARGRVVRAFFRFMELVWPVRPRRK